MSILSDELQKPLYASMSDAEAAAEINAVNKTQTYSRFGSFRTLASLLTPVEYNALRNILTAASAQEVYVADMVEMLKLPGDEHGNGGGIDFGSPAVISGVEYLRSSIVSVLGEEAATTMINKLIAYAQRITSTGSILGLPVIFESDVYTARLAQ